MAPRHACALAGIGLAIVALCSACEPRKDADARVASTAAPAPEASPPVAVSPEQPSCRTSGPERAPTEAWVLALRTRADATREAEDVRKATKAELLLASYEDDDCWEVHDRFDAICGKAHAATVSIECQRWWDRTFAYRSGPRTGKP